MTSLTDLTKAKIDALADRLRENAPLMVAYSGGVDSAYLIAFAAKVLGERVTGVIADSPSLPRQALADALVLAGQLGVRVEVIATEEIQNPDYAANPINRCYYCKAELFGHLDHLARQRGFRAVAYGENADDMAQVRPGRQAAEEFSVIAPLRDVGLTKSEIREHSRLLGLPTAEAPAQPCLSSRIPFGTPVTAEALALVEKAEGIVRGFGFRVFRVRHIVSGKRATARVQIAPEEMGKLDGIGGALVTELIAAGYGAAEIDPEGYRSGWVRPSAGPGSNGQK